MGLRHYLGAVAGLWGRYARVFMHAWKHRRSMKSDFFNQQEAEFLPARLSLQEAPSSPTLLWTGRVLMLMVLFVVAWAMLGRLDIVVNASGKVIPSMRTKTIASVDTASVRALHVIEGQAVRMGEVLVELDSSSSDAEHNKAADAVAQARLQVARSQAMLEAVDTLQAPVLPRLAGVDAAQWQAASLQLQGQYEDFHARRIRLEGEIARYQTLLPLATQRAEDMQALLADHTVAYHAWLEKEQARLDFEAQLQDARNQRSALIAQVRKDAHDALLEGRKIVVAGQQDQRRAGEHSRLLKLRAPVAGTVQQLTLHTVGGVVSAAQPLMLIVPREDVVEVEAFIENKDIGFVQPGQSAAVKIDAFEYTKYGTMQARVKQVSEDAIQDEKKGLIYSSKILLDKRTILVDGKYLPLSAGMSVTVEIKTGSRRVIEYILSPLMRHQRESLNER